MNARGILVGTKVKLKLFNGLGVKIGKTYSGEFFEIVGDMEVIIFTVGQEPVSPIFSKTVKVSASFNHHMHGLLNFNGILTRKEETKIGTKFYITIDDDFQNVQKREYFRTDSFFKAEYRLAKELNNTNTESIEENPYKSTQTKNISFTGVCIILDENENISMDSMIDLIVWFNDKLNIKILCKVIRITEFEIKGKRKYEIGMLLKYISEEDKELLTKYITKSVINRSLYWGETPSNV